MIPPTQSLVKYDNPVLLSKTTDKKSTRSRPKKPTSMPPVGSTSRLGATMTSGAPVPSLPKTQKLPPVDKKAQQETDDILNSIIPPREYTESGQLWVQQVSATPATRLDVLNLQEQLDAKLQQRQARETGICPVRRELYAQVFDELIRQVTINCAERGLLLLRVRNEIRMTLAAYQTLYESSVAFGIRKALQAEQDKVDMQAEIEELRKEKAEFEEQISQLKAKCDESERKAAEQLQAEQRKHEEELQFLKRTNTQLKTQLESILAPSKK